MGNLAGNAWTLLRNRGGLRVLRHLPHWLAERYHERRFDVATATPERLAELGVSDPRCVDYEAPAYATLFRTFRHLRVEPGRSVFLDYGCGRGRALVVAATLPFARVVGVELVPSLAAAARDNLRRAAPRLTCRDAEVVDADARDYRPPPDVDNIYLYNPFRGEILEAVVASIEASLRRRPRPLTIAFLNPDHFERCTAGADWLDPVHEFDAYPDTRVTIYRARPEEFGGGDEKAGAGRRAASRVGAADAILEVLPEG